jgi:hypothetical protein
MERDRLGAAGECAGYLYCSPCKWNLMDMAKPDLEDFIEIRTRSKSNQGLTPYPDSIVDGFAYLLVNGEDAPMFEIVGWCWGYEAKTAPLNDRIAPGFLVHLIDPDSPLLRPPEELWDEVRRRRDPPPF